MIYVVVICVIVALLLTTAVLRSLRVRSQADFLVAGRSLRWPVLIFTLLSSWIGAGSLFAGGENAYRNGFAALWQPAGGWCGLIVIACIAGRARRFAQFTVPDLLEARYNTAARVFATVAIVISYTMITSYQFKAGGDVLHLIFPSLEKTTGMYIIAGFVIAFTALAGMGSVAYLDLIIGSLVTVIAIVAVPLLLENAGGWAAVKQALPPDHFTFLGPLTFAQAMGFLLPTFLLLIGNQGMYQKFFSARSERDAKLAVAGWIVGTTILETVIITIAVVGSSKFHTPNPREIIPMTARLGLPAVAGAVLLGGIFAKVISTANNFLFSPASNLIHDVYKRFVNPDASERRTLVVSRALVVALGIFALVQGAYFESILKAALYAYTVYGAAVTPAIMAVFFWKRATAAGAVTSILMGTVVTVVWDAFEIQTRFQQSPWIRNMDAVYPALMISMAGLIVVSLLSAPPPREKWAAFFEERVEVGTGSR
ncbi:MAG TPA: sodium:solute symporter family protein [Bryobacteraceae bacterium]|nr:sodium:solute symporter family protein [Bryobacteraceae bacterium]